jgi:hypothetical protein
MRIIILIYVLIVESNVTNVLQPQIIVRNVLAIDSLLPYVFVKKVISTTFYQKIGKQKKFNYDLFILFDYLKFIIFQIF